MLDSSHGNSYGMDQGMTPLDQQHQYFGSVNFPITKETEAWKEKVSIQKGPFLIDIWFSTAAKIY